MDGWNIIQRISKKASKFQPIDMGSINSMKCQFKKIVSTRKIKCAENNVKFNITILDALHMISMG